MEEYYAIGVMSGTSLDGLDIACCKFWKQTGKWNYEIRDAYTITYPGELKNQLKQASVMPGKQLFKLHKEYGLFIGEALLPFFQEKKVRINLIASHGHTVFHSPEKGITLQIGDGASIASFVHVPVVCDFRSTDVALGGQGAPLVPFGDKMLFNEYNSCLNLGGFANISYTRNEKTVAFDICPANSIINILVNIYYKDDYDKDGKYGKAGMINGEFLNTLNALHYYSMKSPKSLGREWLEEKFLPLVQNTKDDQINILRTVYEHIAVQIARVIKNSEVKNILVTGGGAKNTFLINLIKNKTQVDLVIPEEKLIDYKEAMIFAFLGVIRLRNEVNCLSSVTGACRDHSTGFIYRI